VQYWPNTNLSFVKSPAGEFVFPLPSGEFVKFTEAAEGAGVDSEARSDVPSAVVRCLDKKTGQELGKHFLSLWFYMNYERNRRLLAFGDRIITIDGKKHFLVLRNKRVYKDYSIELLQFEHGKYPGTDIPKDFASTVMVRDEGQSEGREVRIWMNNPLRYHGDSLFQHAVMAKDSGTILQVVDNPGRLMPYLSCIMVTLGMIVHFGIRLLGFLQKPRVA
jgi:hypothetical protein